MANTSKTVKGSSSKRAMPKPDVAVAVGKPVTVKTKPAVKSGPVVKATAVPKKAAAKADVAKTIRSPRKKKAVTVPLEQRRYYVEVAAYHIAERRGFAPGDPLADWIQAEAEIDRLLAAGHLGG